jgi:hypothetical protein
MTVDDLLFNYSFHDSTVNKVVYDDNKKVVELDIEMCKNDFTDNLSNFLIRYDTVLEFNANFSIKDIDWTNASAEVLIHEYSPVKGGYKVRYFIQLMNYNTREKQYLDIHFYCSGSEVKLTSASS